MYGSKELRTLLSQPLGALLIEQVERIRRRARDLDHSLEVAAILAAQGFLQRPGKVHDFKEPSESVDDGCDLGTVIQDAQSLLEAVWLLDHVYVLELDPLYRREAELQDGI